MEPAQETGTDTSPHQRVPLSSICRRSTRRERLKSIITRSPCSYIGEGADCVVPFPHATREDAEFETLKRS